MASGDEKEERGFTLVDRRSSAGGGETDAQEEAGGPPPPPIDFSTFVLSLGTSALFHLGLVEDPTTGQLAEKNPVLARQTIDTLSMLQEKTRGNLDSEEAQLIESLLYELRMRFVDVEK